MSNNQERRRQNIERNRARLRLTLERRRILNTRPLTAAEAQNLRQGERPFGTTIRRNVDGINIFISCHGDIAPPDLLASYGEPDRIQVPANTTYHFYTEPGQNFYGCNGWDTQQVDQCNYIMDHGVYATGINFSMSAGHNIPNFIISAEPDQSKFMSRVVACVQKPDDTTRLLKLFNIHEHLENSWATVFLPSQSQTAHWYKFVPFLTLQQIVSRISGRVSGLQKFARLNGGSDHVHYHCMFCQAGTVPNFWENERLSVIAADTALLQTQSSPSTPSRHIGPEASIRYQYPLSADREARRRNETTVSPTRTFTTPPGQGAVSRTSPGQGRRRRRRRRRSTLTRAFSSQSSPNVRNAAIRSARARVSPERAAEEEENNLERNRGQFLAEDEGSDEGHPQVQLLEPGEPLRKDFEDGWI